MLKAELEDAYTALQQEHEGLLLKVVKHAAMAAYEHDLCTVVEETLKQAGIPVPDVEFTLTEKRVVRFKMGAVEAHRFGLFDRYHDESDRATRIKEALEDEGMGEYVVDEESSGTVFEVTKNPLENVA